MFNKTEIEAFEKAGYSYEEIEHIYTSMFDFKKTGVSYTSEEMANIIDNKIFSKYKTLCTV